MWVCVKLSEIVVMWLGVIVCIHIIQSVYVQRGSLYIFLRSVWKGCLYLKTYYFQLYILYLSVGRIHMQDELKKLSTVLTTKFKAQLKATQTQIKRYKGEVG